MSHDTSEQVNDLLAALTERAKELNCLYGVEEILNEPDIEPDEACVRILELIPPGWQYPHMCVARIQLRSKTLESPDFIETRWRQTARIRVQNKVAGSVDVFYTEPMPEADDGPFLKEEARLIRTIAERIGHYTQHFEMRRHFQAMESAREDLAVPDDGDWRVVFNLLRRTDRDLLQKLAQKLLHYLCWSGSQEAEALLEESDSRQFAEEDITDANRPQQSKRRVLSRDLSEATFRIAAQSMPGESLLALVQKWLQEEQVSFLASAVERNLPLSEVADAIRRYCHITSQDEGASRPTGAHIRVALIRRFLSEQLGFIRHAKEFLDIDDFRDLMPRVIASGESQGRLGGKSAGVILASRILRKMREQHPEVGEIRTPKTWHVTSDMHIRFMHYNNLDGVSEQKYKDLDQIRFEYPHIIHSCKNSRFPPELVNGLSVALDDFGDSPIIVRSSSVLEDRIGAAFSGKYKSLFLGNQGTKQERMDALLDAIAEVYASMFAPDPIQYRTERGLLDFAEEMGILIQEVIGKRVGRYYFPFFAGVALSRNEFRWSPRIKREDGLVRMVPGLGTRAVDRVGDDYPIMFAPGQPALRVNVTTEEILRYSPRWLDVIDLESNTFVTLSMSQLIQEYGDEIPHLNRMVSIYDDGRLRRPGPLDSEFPPDGTVVTFEGQITNPKFLAASRAILNVLEEQTGNPVDIEFAHDGEHLYLLQCRSQSDAAESQPAPIPKDVSRDRVVFTANRYVSNGYVPDITHVVYVDPEGYANLGSRNELLDVGRAVGELNKLLPKRQFILLGPGRWGSRGDIKLGVSVTYADINNTAVLVEVARKQGNYTPDLSFGTHFFQDLVEAQIRYLPLYPDDEGIIFAERFFTGHPSILVDLLPQYSHLESMLRVIDVAKVTDGLVLKVLMNADLDEAMCVLSEPGQDAPQRVATTPGQETRADDHSQWRMRMAERIASALEADRFGVKDLYVFGSTKNFTAGPGSDIDLLVHIEEDEDRTPLLRAWLEGWSRSLDEVNYLRTGYRAGGLLDVHLITDRDIENRTSFAVKIGAVTDAARQLPMGGA